MKALSIRQPWAYSILKLGKDVENRSRRTNYRGEFLIHAARNVDWDDFRFLRFSPKSMTNDVFSKNDFWKSKAMTRGALVGKATLVDCVEDYDSPWAIEGQYQWVLENPITFDEPVYFKGRLGFFEVEGQW